VSVETGDTITYRVTIHPTTNKVNVMSFDLDAIDATGLGVYDTINETPKWIQERIATLMLVDPTPPTEPIVGIGHRIDKTTYWIYADR
jgi:hypothetical protein